MGMIRQSLLAVVSMGLILVSESASEPILWIGGTWDDTGAPKGALLTGNSHWWGSRVQTGVTYAYENAPLKLKDGKDPGAVGGVLLAGFSWSHYDEWRLQHVSSPKAEPIAAVFDFHRDCRFEEIDLLSALNTNETACVSFSADGLSWGSAHAVPIRKLVTRLKLEPSIGARYLKVSVAADDPGADTALARVLAWGSAEVTAEKPEVIVDIDPGDSIKFPDVAGEGLVIVPVRIPRLAAKAKPTGAQPKSIGWRMTRNETESRYFAVVNRGGETQTVAFALPDFGAGVESELYVGGVIGMQRPPRALTEAEMVNLQTTNRFFAGIADAGKLDLYPFIPADAALPMNFCRRYLANAAQVHGFPKAVPICPGEGCVVMLRVKTKGAVAGLRRGTFTAGKSRLPIEIRVVDLTLGSQWMDFIYAYMPFTYQFPFQTLSRCRKDVERYADMGPTTTLDLPEPGTKEEMFFKRVPNARVGTWSWCGGGIDGESMRGRFDGKNPAQVKIVEESAHRLVRKMKELGYPLDRCIAFTHDEPGPSNAKSIFKVAEVVKRAEPDLLVYSDPCFWSGNGFASSEVILENCEPEYTKYIDVSVPHFDILFRPELKHLWFAPRKINATYTHPATRFTVREVAKIYGAGCNGYAFYSYQSPFKDPWDVRTFSWGDPSYLAVLPLEKDVALTVLYENMRECAESVRLYRAVEARGRKDLVDRAIEEMDGAWDRLNAVWNKYDPEKPDVLDVRDRLLSAFDVK